MGQDPKYSCMRPAAKTETGPTTSGGGGLGVRSSGGGGSGTANADSGSSDEEEDDDDLSSTGSALKPTGSVGGTSVTTSTQMVESGSAENKIPIPLMDYILNVVSSVERN